MLTLQRTVRFGSKLFRDPLYLGLFAAQILNAAGTVITPLATMSIVVYAFTFALLERATRLRAAFAVGFFAAFFGIAAAMSWIITLLEAFASFPWLAAFATATLAWFAQSLPLAFSCGVYFLLRPLAPSIWTRVFLFAFSIPTAEGLFPQLFPFRITVPLINVPSIAIFASVGGTLLVAFFAAFFGAFFSSAILQRSRRAFSIGTVFLLLFVGVGFGSLRAAEAIKPDSRSRVGVVQPNVSIQMKHDPATKAEQYHRLLALSTRLEREMSPDVIIWPETAFPYAIPVDIPAEWPPFRNLHTPLKTPLIFGVLRRGKACEKYNSIIGLDSKGVGFGISDKVKLMPFGETIPFWHQLPILQKHFRCPGFLAAAAPQTFTSEDLGHIGVLNCYEDVIPDFASELLRSKRVDYFINLTNDAWFGDTLEPKLHELVARWRTIETGRELVRVVNTGVSSHIDRFGRLVWETDTFTQDARLAIVRQYSYTTWNQRIGHFLEGFLVAGLSVLLLLSLLNYQRRRRRS